MSGPAPACWPRSLLKRLRWLPVCDAVVSPAHAGSAAANKCVLSLCTVRLVLTAAAGSVGGVVLVAVWWRFGTLGLCILCAGLVLGFLVAAVAFFTPLGRRCGPDFLCVDSLFGRFIQALWTQILSCQGWRCRSPPSAELRKCASEHVAPLERPIQI